MKANVETSCSLAKPVSFRPMLSVGSSGTTGPRTSGPTASSAPFQKSPRTTRCTAEGPNDLWTSAKTLRGPAAGPAMWLALSASASRRQVRIFACSVQWLVPYIRQSYLTGTLNIYLLLNSTSLMLPTKYNVATQASVK